MFEVGKSTCCHHFDGANSFCSYGFEKTSMDSHDAAAACYELTMLEIRRYSSLLAGISLHGPATATILIAWHVFV